MKKTNNIKAKYVKYDYIITEMIDDIMKSIENVDSVITGQTELIEYLKKAENEKFNGFIEQLEKATEQLHDQKRVLEHRLDCANKVKFMLTTAKETSFILAMLLEAFGVANKEAKSLDERADNKEEVITLDIVHQA